MDRSFLLKTDLRDLVAAKRWIRRLVYAEMDFHFEDSPEEIIFYKTNEKLFSSEEARIVRQQIAGMYKMDWGVFECPIGYMLSVIEERDSKACRVFLQCTEEATTTMDHVVLGVVPSCARCRDKMDRLDRLAKKG